MNLKTPTLGSYILTIFSVYTQSMNSFMSIFLVDLVLTGSLIICSLLVLFVFLPRNATLLNYLLIASFVGLAVFLGMILFVWNKLRTILIYEILAKKISSVSLSKLSYRFKSLYNDKSYGTLSDFYTIFLKQDIKTFPYFANLLTHAFASGDLKINKQFHKIYVNQAYPYYRYTSGDTSGTLKPAPYTSEINIAIRKLINSYGIARIILQLLLLFSIVLSINISGRIGTKLLPIVYGENSSGLFLLILILLATPVITSFYSLTSQLLLIAEVIKHKYVLKFFTVIERKRA